MDVTMIRINSNELDLAIGADNVGFRMLKETLQLCEEIDQNGEPYSSGYDIDAEYQNFNNVCSLAQDIDLVGGKIQGFATFDDLTFVIQPNTFVHNHLTKKLKLIENLPIYIRVLGYGICRDVTLLPFVPVASKVIDLLKLAHLSQSKFRTKRNDKQISNLIETYLSRPKKDITDIDQQYSDSIELVTIPSGTFLMGSPENDPQRYEDESPQHEVTIEAFLMGKYPVTQAQWRTVAALPKVNIDLNPEPSNFKGLNNPVENVNWYEAVEFCNRLSQLSGKKYRLPTEAEWEYACRAGTTTPFHFRETITADLANYDWDYGYNKIKVTKEKDFNGTTPVGSFPANGFGLYDMHGNVWEWCADDWHEDYDGAPTDGTAWMGKIDQNQLYKVIRGGSWLSIPRFCRSACRNFNFPGVRYYLIGFRLVCEIPKSNNDFTDIDQQYEDYEED